MGSGGVNRVKTGVWRFGEAEFDEAQGSLSVAGQAVELDRNCAAILAMLLQEASREVAKERLLQAGWPDRIVHENSLAKAVGRLRKALGPDGDAIETLYGFGYRFNGAPLRATDPAHAALPSDRAGPAPSGRKGPRRPPLAVAAIAILALAGLGAAYIWSRVEVARGQEFRTEPPVTADAPGLHSHATALATSCGVVSLPRGMTRVIIPSASSREICFAAMSSRTPCSVMSVSV